MTYPDLVRAFYQAFNGPNGPDRCALAVEHKPFIAQILAAQDVAVIGPYKDLVYNGEVYEAVLKAPWVMFKGMMVMFDQAIPINQIRFWMPDGQLKEITIENDDNGDE